MLARDDLTPLNKTPLHGLHVSLGAKMVPFAGYDMPVQYPAGVLREHLHTRSSAGLFDVSHMGQIALTAKSGRVEDAAAALETLMPQDILGLPRGRQRYAQFTDANGGILDDLMVANFGNHLFLVVNAACKAADEAHLRAQLADTCVIEPLDERALIALQGPKAETVLAKFCAEAPAMRFMDAGPRKVMGLDCIVSRSGYTGEDGFEISVAATSAEELTRALLAEADVQPIGLGARDSLRLEAGLCLYGHDIDTTTTPVEATLEWSVQKVRRPGGQRAGGFLGAEKILAQFGAGAPRRRVGLKPEGRAPVREGANLFADEGAAEPVGKVTSGGFGPTLNAPVAMGYLPAALAAIDTKVFAEVRGQRLALRVAATPFVKNTYKR
ncbi:glycine cleavage system aminomethyltransferase GcvT [Bradyrhizobium sp.]|uniref:glycine cleavage system aminomethyltransferase GcvT n=2 Tax=Bradyrhizobium sp. TaxID=376 RepID=UPI001D75119B|nr:glycine cleavage system aminomethyltransferase GcvT [Bradyrhizobium sp.]MBV8696893.1 glycine cleavage system aminomethyltransferase GcvT [Bradyrhizobium sp.]MBV9984718.1 glycine cleavage system aminomethyltransferase GcvT [Bradyrhizobium sp.]